MYEGNHYDACINIDNGGEPWCNTNVTNKHWESCNTATCPDTYGKQY